MIIIFPKFLCLLMKFGVGGWGGGGAIFACLSDSVLTIKVLKIALLVVSFENPYRRVCSECSLEDHCLHFSNSCLFERFGSNISVKNCLVGGQFSKILTEGYTLSAS